MTLLARYIAQKTLRGIFMAFVIITAIIMLVDFVEATRTIGDDANLSLIKLASLTALKTPQLIEQTIPFVVLFGVMGTLFGLNKRSELIVLRASGLSAWRIITPCLFVTAFLGLAWAFIFNPFAALSMSQYRNMVASVSTPTATHNTQNFEDIWLREGSNNGQIVIHGQLDLSKPETLTDVTFYYYDFLRQQVDDEFIDIEMTEDLTEFTRRIDAKKAVLHSSSYWQVYDLIENKEGLPLTRSQSASLPTRITLDDLKDHTERKNRPAFWDTPAEITRTEDAGFSSVALRLHLHKLLSLPLMLIAMTFLAASVSMHLARQGSALRLILTGSAIGFGVYFCDSLFGAFGGAQSLPVILAAWSVPLLTLFLGIAYLTKIEDG